MSVSNELNQKEEYLKDAIYNGIEADAVNSTIEDMLNKVDEIGKKPKQVKKVVETIVDMKKDVSNIESTEYASSFVNQNSEKIKHAINDGISSKEIAKTLVENTKNAKDKKSKRQLKFITKLISKMKVKELNLKKQNTNEKGIQKVFTKVD